MKPLAPKLILGPMLALVLAAGLARAQRPLPILDMHLHAKVAADFGPPPRPLCISITLHGVVDPECPEPILSPAIDDAMIDQTVEILERRLGSPLLLEDVRVRHPKLRVYVMHYGSPLVDEMIAVLYTHPQVYVDLGGIQWAYPREYFYGQLKKFIDALRQAGHVRLGPDGLAWG